MAAAALQYFWGGLIFRGGLILAHALKSPIRLIIQGGLLLGETRYLSSLQSSSLLDLLPATLSITLLCICYRGKMGRGNIWS